MYMLGKFVDVSVKDSAYRRSSGSSIGKHSSLFYGYVTNPESSLYRKKVYIIANNNLTRKQIKSQIIASIQLGYTLHNRQKIAVAAPLGHVFYLPEIRNRLCKARTNKMFKLSCLYEKSCGAIVFRDDDNGKKQFLLIKHKKNKHWGFPKGHTEMHETDEQTAKREVKEETSLDIEILKGFKQVGFYRPYSKIEKKVVLFLAKMLNKNAKVKVQRKEIDAYKWASTEEIFYSLSTANDRCVFESALNWLNKLEEKLEE